MREILIYGLSSSNNPEQIRYIGQTSNSLQRRLIMHKSKAKIETNHRACWIRSELKKGNDIIISYIDSADENNWAEKEINYIKQFKSFGAKLVNTTIGGEGNLGARHTDATKLKMSITRTGLKRKPHTKETKQKIREATLRQFKEKGHPKGMLGKKQSKESIDKRENTKQLNKLIKTSS